MATIRLTDNEPEFSVDQDSENQVTLTIYAEGQTVTVNIGDSPDDANEVCARLSRLGDQLGDIVSQWEDLPRPYDDGFITLDRRGRWFVTLGGNARGDHKYGYASEEIATYELARAMAADGDFPNAWAEGEHGPTTRAINDAVRAFHDEGGDKLRPLPGAVFAATGELVRVEGDDWQPWVVDGDYGDQGTGGLGVILYTSGDPDVRIFREDHDGITPYEPADGDPGV